MSDKPFAGVLGILEGMCEDGTIDRFNDLAEQRTKPMMLTVYLDGTFKVQSEGDAHYAAQSEPDWVANIDIAAVKAAIKEAKA